MIHKEKPSVTEKGKKESMTQAEKNIAQVRSQRPRKNGATLFSIRERKAFTSPAVMVEEVLSKVDLLQKPWEKEDLLRRAIKKAHFHIKKCRVTSPVGLLKARQWALAIDILNDKLEEMDQQGSMMRKALTCTFSLLKGGRSKEIYYRKGVVGTRKDRSKIIGALRKVKPYVVEGVRSFPAEKDKNGKVTAWVPGISVDARMEPRMLAAQGSRWHQKIVFHPNGTKDIVLFYDLGLVRFVTHASPSVRLLGEAEMGREDEFLPLEEPTHGQLEVRRDASSNHIELSNDFDRAFNVVDEERVNRRYTYSPEREQEWLNAMLTAVELAKTPRALMWVMDEFIQPGWKAKAFRFNVYEKAHNACVLKGKEKCPDHKIIGQWSTVGDADMQIPVVTPEFEKWALKNPTNKKVRNLSAHWDNLLRREGLGAGFDGQPFSDTSEDALEQKEARAGDGTIECLDRMLSGDDDRDEDESPTKGGPVHTQAADTYLSLEDIQNEKMCPEEAFSLAAALFGRTRGASVDLIHKPRVSATPWKSIPRPGMKSYESPEDLITAAVLADLKGRNLVIHPIDVYHPDFAPNVEGFDSLNKALTSLVDKISFLDKEPVQGNRKIVLDRDEF